MHPDYELMESVQALAPTDVAGAERLARRVSDETSRSITLKCVTRSAVMVNIGEAVRIAKSITVDSIRVEALAEIAESVAAANPAYARRLLDEAKEIADTITDITQRSALSALQTAEYKISL